MSPSTIAPPSEPAVPSVLGCDVGKASIVVFDSRDERTTTIANRPDALQAFAASLDATCLIVCEATGGYEDALLHAAVTAGIPAHRADARKVKAFIRSFGILGKTDAIDAKVLATPRRLPPTRASVTPASPAGRRANPTVTGSRPWCCCAATSSTSASPSATAAAHPGLSRRRPTSRLCWPASTRRSPPSTARLPR